MKKFFLILFVSCFCSLLGVAQQKYTISGHVKDAASGEDIIGASVFAVESKLSVAANIYGFYSLTLPEGKHTITVSNLGYNNFTQVIELNKNIVLDINLEIRSEQLKEVEITSEKSDANVKDIQMSVAKLDIKTIQKVPAFLGEVDLIKVIQLLPGVSTVGEGATGFNVRGGSIDQNLVLLDDAPVY
ncbi:MAG: carboxypeptidase-like regulatory domain-containing protein, partial [Bacteroidota bacterium]